MVVSGSFRSTWAKNRDAPSREVTDNISPSETNRYQCGVPAGTWARAPAPHSLVSPPTPSSTSPLYMYMLSSQSWECGGGPIPGPPLWTNNS